MPESPDFDVAVVGAGGAGMAAAIHARQAGASVLVVEAGAAPGGSTALSGGSIMAAGTPVQAAAGFPDDSAQEFFDYYMTFNRWDTEPAVVRRYCDESAATLAWLQSIGVVFRPENLYRAGRERIPRSHRPDGAGAELARRLHMTCRDLDIDIALGTRVDSLLEGEGRIRGLVAQGEQLTAGAVIVTAGGFAQNRAMLEEHFSDACPPGRPTQSPAPPTNVGDGILMSEKVGAGTAGHNRGVVLLSPGVVSDIEPFLPGWLVFIDGTGQRYISEQASYSVLAPITAAHGGTCWVVLDDESCRAARPDPNSAWGAGTWVTETILAAVEDGRILTSPTVGGLAEQMGVPAASLEATLERYNEDCAARSDTLFFKDPSALRPVATPPFYAVRMLPSIVPLTGYGLRIDADARVLRASDHRPLPGLYAAGEVTGNVLGPQYLGGGNSVTNAILFGSVAGRTAVADRHG